MTVNVGIVGFGDGGRCNFEGIRRAGAKVVAICDTDENLVHELCENPKFHDITLFSDIREMVRRQHIQLVIVATPDNQHLEPAKIALEAGKYVFIEKPVATSIDDLVRFNELTMQFPGKILYSEKHSFGNPMQAVLSHRQELGEFFTGMTLYTMWGCDRIMGGGKWRTEHAYNPCAGGLSHNFMSAQLFVGAPITKVYATGSVQTYHENLDLYGGYDTMEGLLEFANGKRLGWLVCLAVRTPDSPFAHRCVTHLLQFKHGAFNYGLRPEDDYLVVNGQRVDFPPEPIIAGWQEYNLGTLYRKMHEDTLATMAGAKPLHDIKQGINAAHACVMAFESAKFGGIWLDVG